MRTVLVLAAVLAVCCVAAVTSERSSTIPLFAWSGKPLFSQKNEQLLDTLTVQDIDDSLQALLFKTNSQNFIKITGNPDSIVLFVEPELQTDQVSHFGGAYATATNDGASFAFLKNIVESSKASVVAPYVSTGGAYSMLDSILARTVRKMGDGAVLLIRNQGSTLLNSISRYSAVHTMDINDISGETFSNGVPALVIVCLEKASTAADFATHGSMVESVIQPINAATRGSFIAMYTGNSAETETTTQYTLLSQQRRSVSDYYYSVGGPQNTTGNGTSPRTYLSGPILEAFMVLITLLTMLFVGLCNLCSLQVPEQFETPKVVKLAAM